MRFNLSAWALHNRQVVVYLMLLVAVVGVLSYGKLGQSEDPPFTFKAMVIQTQWPGATAEEVSRQVTERIEKKLMETGEYERIVSFSRPGESNVTFMARDSLRSKDIPELWYQIRKKIGDIRHTLPPGIQGPFFDDEFGTTFGNIYALTGKGFDYAVLKDYADRIQLQLQRVKSVGKVELIGLQDEKIWIELSNVKLATLGVPLEAVHQALQAQNAVSAAGFVETPSERVQLRVSGNFTTAEQIRDFPIRFEGRTFRLGDVAEVRRGFNEPPAPRMRFMGEPALGLAVSMKAGGDILMLGEALEQEFARLQQELPVGMQLRKVSDQPAAVKTGVGEFVRVLIEALAIVLLVSFFSLGMRTGLVVALSIPLVLAMTFATMHYLDIGLHKISLGALVLALGLLVDDAIIAVEMMAIKMEQGYDRLKAASFAWTSTAFPMLTGTLITAAGFLPIATANSSTGEYTRSIFQVVTIALIASWIAAVTFVPLLGDKVLPDLAARAARKHGGSSGGHDPYSTAFYQRVRRVVALCVRRRKTVIVLTLAAFVAAVALFRLVPQQFFPASGRLELMVDLKLAEGASLKATEAEVRRLEAMLKDRAGIDNYVAYVGTGSPRFYLPLDQQLPATSFAQFVVLAQSIEAREELRGWLIERLREDFSALRGRVTRLENGPPVGYPVQFRVTGEHIDVVRAHARQVAAKVAENPHVANVHLDWQGPSRAILVYQARRADCAGHTAGAGGFPVFVRAARRPAAALQCASVPMLVLPVDSADAGLLAGRATQLARRRDRCAFAQEQRRAVHRERSGAAAVRVHPGGHRHRAQAAVRTSAARGPVRRTDRRAESCLFRRPPGHGAGTGAAQRRTVRLALHRSGSLQAGQQQLRPQCRRPSAAGGRRTPGALRARQRYGRPAGWGRIRGVAGKHRASGGCRAGRRQDSRRVRAAG
ncbi:Multidrug resistance protein MdtC [Stutzerimonas stutzeri]